MLGLRGSQVGRPGLAYLDDLPEIIAACEAIGLEFSQFDSL